MENQRPGFTALSVNQPTFPSSTAMVSTQNNPQSLPPFQHNVAELQQQILSLKLQMEEMNKTLTALYEENQELREKLQQKHIEETGYPSWEEEERIVEEETIHKPTAWIVQESRKKKKGKIPSSSTTYPQQKKLSDKPPPIIINVEKGLQPLTQALNQQQVQYKSTRLNDHQLKVNVENGDHYRAAVKTLNDISYEYHSYENKQTRPIKVMARNIHQTITEQEVHSNLAKQGFKIIQVNQKMKSVKNESGTEYIKLPLFMLTFAPEEEAKKVHEIKYICNMKVNIESLRTNKLIPQCKRCQQFNHTQNFCKNAFKCVKCGNSHNTKFCEKDKSTPPKCCNCGEAHPANYRGCSVAKKLQELRDKKMKSGSFQMQNKQNKILPTSSSSQSQSQLNKKISYSQALKNTAAPMQTQNNSNINDILSLILGKMEVLEGKIKELSLKANAK